MRYNMALPPDDALPDGKLVAKPSTRRQARSSIQFRQPMPFDPADLSRRLNVVVEQRQAHTQRRKMRRESARTSSSFPVTDDPKTEDVQPKEKAKRRKSAFSLRGLSHNEAVDSGVGSDNGSSNTGSSPRSYVPQVAASQFEDTTTTTAADTTSNGGLVHKLSRKAMRFHLGGAGSAANADEHSSPADRTRALRRAQSQREKVLDRNQFQRDRILEEAAEADEEREARMKHHQRHTIYGQLQAGLATGAGRLSGDDPRQGDALRRVSTGETRRARDSQDQPGGWAGEHAEVPPVPSNQAANPSEHRVDWTQSDEIRNDRSKTARTLGSGTKASSPLRKAQSIWTLRGVFIKKATPEDGRLAKVGTPQGPTLRTTKSGFFARFRVSH